MYEGLEKPLPEIDKVTIEESTGRVLVWQKEQIQVHDELTIPYKYPLIIGIILTCIGIGMLIFSFFS